MWGKYYLYGGTKIFPASDFATPPPLGLWEIRPSSTHQHTFTEAHAKKGGEI